MAELPSVVRRTEDEEANDVMKYHKRNNTRRKRNVLSSLFAKLVQIVTVSFIFTSQLSA